MITFFIILESFMDFLMQRGGDVVQLPGENGKESRTGFFIPFTRPRRSDHESNRSNIGGDESSEHDETEDDAPIYPAPQAILGNSSDDQQQPLNYVNGHRSPVNLSNYHSNGM